MMVDIPSILAWGRANLFSSPLNGFLTLLGLGLVVVIIPPSFSWLFFDAVWRGGAEACAANPEAACWSFIYIRMPQFIYGFYDDAERWRVNIVLLVFFAGMGFLAWPKTPNKNRLALFMLVIFPVLAWILLIGGVFGLPSVPTSVWGGFFLTLVIASVGIVISLPLGILLALARQSTNLPILKSLAIIFIEFWRGVPLITVLFMASVMFPLFLPEGVNIDQLLRAMVGFALFASAYMAEVVRGGLQSIPKGQYEAANALGLSYWAGIKQIILPQALRTVIPGIVNTFIGLFKDTTLVLIIGLFDFLGMIQASILSPLWSIKSVAFSGYIFAAAIFFIFCYAMSLYSRHIERKLSVGRRY